jgi:hypothetical protein
MGYVRAYREGDAEKLAPLLRAADLQEIAAATVLSPLDCLRAGAEISVPACTIIGNEYDVAGIFGVNPQPFGGRVWMFGSDELTRNPLKRQFLKECKQYLAGMERMYPCLFNHVDERNTVHIKWLRWMGFTFIRRKPFGPQGLPFLEFIKLCATSA